ncbi:MAG: PQQ-binding-like beta-propeller repeat protein [Verrucomicrobiota bacterium]
MTPRVFAVFLAFAPFLAADDWPEFRGKDRAGVWNQPGVVQSFPEGDAPLKRVWTAPVGSGYSGPTVAGDGVYLMDRGPTGNRAQLERIVCIDRNTGKQAWAHTYPCAYSDVGYAYGPRSSVTVREGKAWSLGTMGHLHCLNAETGEVIWAHDLRTKYTVDLPIWGLTASPLVFGDVVVVQIGAMADSACIVGFEKDSGKEVWRAFADKASYVSPIMIQQGETDVLVVWTGFRIAGMNPANGEIYWELPTRPNKMPINVPGPALNEDGTLMFLSVFYDGSRMIQLDQTKPAAKELWHCQGINERNTDALHSMISPPYFADGHVFGIDSYGQMRCLDPRNGDRIWEDQTAVPYGRWGTAFMVKNGEHTWMLNERGQLIIARLTAQGYEEIDRANLIQPTTPLKQRREGTVLWSHPAFAGTQIFARNDRELICVDLAE